MDELISYMENNISDTERETSDTAKSDETNGDAWSLGGLSYWSSYQAYDQTQKNVRKIFGSHDERGEKQLGLSHDQGLSKRYLSFSDQDTSLSTSSCEQSGSGFGKPLKRQCEPKQTIQSGNQVLVPDKNFFITDPHTQIRLSKISDIIHHDNKLNPEVSALINRNQGLPFVPLSSLSAWYNRKRNDKKFFWVSGVLIRKVPGVMKSKNHREFSIWELSDLNNFEKRFSVYLYGSARTSLCETPVGIVVDLRNPTPFRSVQGTVGLTVNLPSQVTPIGQAKDFDHCHYNAWDGSTCANVINAGKGNFCMHHACLDLQIQKGVSMGRRAKADNITASPKKSGKLERHHHPVGKSVPNSKLRNFSTDRKRKHLERTHSTAGLSSVERLRAIKTRLSATKFEEYLET